MGKRGPKRGHGGRPRGGKHPEYMREYWRRIQHEYQIGKKKNVRKAAKVT
jgi:hypothetical protein